MEFIQALNPLYAVPIVAVVFCALIVYTLGFKSPIQPPSFEGLDEDKKISRKRKTKDVQKQSKLVTNGKVNGVATTKGKVQETPKKKEVVDNKINEKPRGDEKAVADKKAAKKTKAQTEKHEKKKENVVSEELNDDGWELFSKKGKKNRKKEDQVSSEIQSGSNQSPVKKIIETGDIQVVDKVSPSPVEVPKEEKKEVFEEKPSKKSNKKETISIPSLEKPAKNSQEEIEEPLKKSSKKKAISVPRPQEAVEEVAVEVKPDESNLKRDLKQSSPNIPLVSEDTSKSKKKKKKQGSTPAVVETSESVPPVQIEPIPKIIDQPVAPPVKVTEPVVDKVPVNVVDDSKSNVVFDELAGLYPETKEKKKKKVRRDH